MKGKRMTSKALIALHGEEEYQYYVSFHCERHLILGRKISQWQRDFKTLRGREPNYGYTHGQVANRLACFIQGWWVFNNHHLWAENLPMGISTSGLGNRSDEVANDAFYGLSIGRVHQRNTAPLACTLRNLVDCEKRS